MAIAAVPAYLGKDFSLASPGLRFGMYLPLWGVDRQTNELVWETRDYKYELRGQDRIERRLPHENKSDALRQALVLTASDIQRMRAVSARQTALAVPLLAQGQLLALDAQATAPFTTGLGNEHPLENGFAFLNPYGLPYLPGSGVKGVLRQAARELESGDWGVAHGWTEDAITHLFGLESDDGDKNHQRGALMFWDVLPQLAGDSLQVDVMTPHQGHYFQQRSDARSGDSVTPHDSGQPNPINFLTVPPGSRFSFYVQCNLPFLRKHAPALADGGRWEALVQAALEHAFAWLGFGAKTAVGYGAMTQDTEAQQRREAARAVAIAKAAAEGEKARLATLGPEDRAWAEAQPVIDAFRIEFDKARLTPYNPGGPFNQARQNFLKTALSWTEPRSRMAAGDLLAETTTKAWGRPSNKDRWAELQAAFAQLRGAA